MTTTYHFYCFGECLYKKKSKTEMLYTALRTIEPDIPDIMTGLNLAREVGKQDEFDVNYAGMYCLCVDDIIVSVIIIKDNKLDRIITIPKFRRQGYALRLIKHITEQWVEHECPVIISPVYPSIAPLFEKAGWVKTGSSCERDGTIDYTPATMLPVFGRETCTWDRRLWMNHLFFLQTHLFKKKEAMPTGQLEAGKKMLDWLVKRNNS